MARRIFDTLLNRYNDIADADTLAGIDIEDDYTKWMKAITKLSTTEKKDADNLYHGGCDVGNWKRRVKTLSMLAGLTVCFEDKRPVAPQNEDAEQPNFVDVEELNADVFEIHLYAKRLQYFYYASNAFFMLLELTIAKDKRSEFRRICEDASKDAREDLEAFVPGAMQLIDGAAGFKKYVRIKQRMHDGVMVTRKDTLEKQILQTQYKGNIKETIDRFLELNGKLKDLDEEYGYSNYQLLNYLQMCLPKEFIFYGMEFRERVRDLKVRHQEEPNTPIPSLDEFTPQLIECQTHMRQLGILKKNGTLNKQQQQQVPTSATSVSNTQNYKKKKNMTGLKDAPCYDYLFNGKCSRNPCKYKHYNDEKKIPKRFVKFVEKAKKKSKESKNEAGETVTAEATTIVACKVDITTESMNEDCDKEEVKILMKTYAEVAMKNVKTKGVKDNDVSEEIVAGEVVCVSVNNNIDIINILSSDETDDVINTSLESATVDSVDSVLTVDSVDSVLTVDSVDSVLTADSVDSVLTVDSVDSVLTVDSVDSVLTVDSVDSVLTVDSVDSVLTVDSVDSVLTVDSVDSVLTVDSVDSVLTVDSVDSALTVDTVESVDSVDSIETIDVTVDVDKMETEIIDNTYEIRDIVIVEDTYCYIDKEYSTMKKHQHVLPVSMCDVNATLETTKKCSGTKEKGSPIMIADDSNDDEENDESRNEFKIGGILRRRKVRTHPTKYEYLIFWEGYPLKDRTWEPEHNIYDKQLLKQFDNLQLYKNEGYLRKKELQKEVKDSFTARLDQSTPLFTMLVETFYSSIDGKYPEDMCREILRTPKEEYSIFHNLTSTEMAIRNARYFRVPLEPVRGILDLGMDAILKQNPELDAINGQLDMV